MSDWIGDCFTSEVGWRHLEALVDVGNRMAGSAGEREAAELTRAALERAGTRDARLEGFDIQGWERGESAIVAGRVTQSCLGLPRSPSATVTAPLIDCGYGLPADLTDHDLEDAIVLVRSDVPSHADRYVHRREKYYRAVEAGAAGFVYRNHVPGCLAPTGSVGTEAAPIGDIPTVGVSSEVGARLARRFDGSEVDLSVEATIGPATSQNVHAELGPDTDECVLVTSHVDAHDIAEGALDNGAGTAMVVELANALTSREGDLETRVEFVCYGAEEVGLVGSQHHATATDTDRVTAVVNNDGVVGSRTLEFVTNGFTEFGDAVRTVGDRFDHPVVVDPTMGPHSDHWSFVTDGVPATHVTSTSDEQGRGYGHTEADTIEKLESRTLREQAIILTELVVELARSDRRLPRQSPEEIAEALIEEDLAPGMRLTGEWPFA